MANYVLDWLFQNHKHTELEGKELTYIHSTHLDKAMREIIHRENADVPEWWQWKPDYTRDGDKIAKEDY